MTLHWVRSPAPSLSRPPSADCGLSSSALLTRFHPDRDNRSFANSAFLGRSFLNVFISSRQEGRSPPDLAGRLHMRLRLDGIPASRMSLLPTGHFRTVLHAARLVTS
jgi:hypothetical protein